MWWKQWWPRRERQEKAEIDIAFLVSEYNRGWVLETICRQIARHWPARTEFVWTKRNRKITAPIPPARVYWFSHFQLLITALQQNPEIRRGRLMVWFTHPSKPEVSTEELVSALNACHAVIFTCSLHRDAMVAQGVRPELAHVVLGAADPDVFAPGSSGSRDRVGFVSAYYERKNPQLMEAIVRAMPEQRFLLVGPKADSMGRTERMWTEYPEFERLASCPNFEYVEADYADYPQHYRRMAVYASTSQLEGGPIALIEAMMCGCVPVVTDTGFARDVVAETGVGHVLPLTAGAAEFRTAIVQARGQQMLADLRRYTWPCFTQRLHELSLAASKADRTRRG